MKIIKSLLFHENIEAILGIEGSNAIYNHRVSMKWLPMQ